MNKTFKVVYNRTRAGLRVANEITSSVQKNGTKIAIATVALALFSSVSLADEALNTWDSQTPPTIVNSKVQLNQSEKQGNVFFVDVKKDASGVFENLDGTLIVKREEGKTGIDQVLGIRHYLDDGEDASKKTVAFGGEKLSLNVETDLKGAGNGQVTAMDLRAPTTISANKVKLSVTSSNSEGKSVYGIATGAPVVISSKEVQIDLKTATDRGEKEESSTIYSQIAGVDIWDSTLDARNVENLTIKGESTGGTKTTNGDNGGSPIVGIVFEKGAGSFGGRATIDVKAKGGNATGVKAINYFYNSTMGENWGNATGNFVNLNSTVHSDSATASAVGIEYTTGQAENKVILAVNGEADLTATTNTGSAYGINLSGKTTAEFKGDVTVHAEGKEAGSTARGVAAKEGVISFIGADKSVTITAKATADSDGFVNSRAVNAYEGGVINLGIVDSSAEKSVKLKEVKLVSDAGADFVARLDGNGTKLNVNAGTYEQTGSGHGIYVVKGAELVMNVDEFKSTTAYTAIHTREAESSKATVTAKTFTATATTNEPGVALLQVNEGSSLTVKADTVNLMGSSALCGGVIGTGTYGTLTLEANELAIEGNINGTYGGVNNQGKTAKLDVKASEAITLSGDINVGSLKEDNALLTEDLKKLGAKSNFSRNTEVSIEAAKASLTGNISVWGNSSNDYDNSSDSNKVSLKFGDGSVINGDITVAGVNAANQMNSVEVTATGAKKDLTFNGKIAVSGGGSIALDGGLYNVESLTGDGKLAVGKRDGAGAMMFVKELGMAGGAIFVDPLYGHSELHVESLGADSTLNTNITAGAGALVSIGSDANKAKSAVAGIDGIGSASTVVFVGSPMTMGEHGRLIVNPDAPAEDTDQSHAKHVIVQNGGVLVVDQAGVGASPVFTGALNVSVDSNSKLGIANATPGTFMLAPIGGDTQLDISGMVLTDNPFVEGALSEGTLTLATSASDEGMSTLASMGIQSMIRRADMVLAETIADRMASEVQTGSNLWVDVRGERYERDNLDNGAGFKADIGYGAFGAELAPTETTTLGVAFQYGNGTVKGDVASVKNKTKDYGFALYGSAMLGDTGVKAIGEVAYTKSTNDITSSLALMNQDTDATMLSAGVKAQKSFDLGTFEVIPSLGVRVSHIKTDAMKAGNVEIEKQKQTIVQIPLALRVNAKATETASGWSVTPKFKVAFIPTVGDKSIEVFGVKQSVIDTSPVQGSFGVGFAKGNLTIDAAAHLGAGNKGTSAVGGKVGLTYRF